MSGTTPEERGMYPELDALRDVLVGSHPSFARIDGLLLDLARDDSVSPAVFDRVCDALFTVLMAYAESVAMNAQSVETLRDLRKNWQRIIEEDVEGLPLIENILYWLIEDLAPFATTGDVSSSPSSESGGVRSGASGKEPGKQDSGGSGAARKSGEST